VIANSQKGFLSFLVLPIFEQWEAFVSFDHQNESDEIDPFLLPVKMIKENLAFWEEESLDPTYFIDNSPPPALVRKPIIPRRMPMGAEEPMTT
jgi:hypothetical protein